MGFITAHDGATIAFADGGEGRDLVLVHGITESRHAWDPVIDALESRWRVVNVDMRGHGESERRAPYDAVTMAADLAAVVTGLGLDEPLVVGHSMGGVIVSAYAGLGHPARGVVNIDQAMALGGFKAALEPLVPMLQGDDASFRDAVATVFAVLDGPLPPGERERLNALASPEQDVVLGVWSTVFESSAEELDALAAELLAGIRVPYLAVHGSDPGTEYVEWLLGLVENARVEVWPDTGHYPHLVDPARCYERLDQFDGGL
ncbi:MAG: alpha/beta fold hydrolase [Acidimicrobiia bacterium]|nr:alpha/beta fold hydrolase [Acidimicrobiia bacterium]